MARSKDPRKTDRWHRGAKRRGDLSPHVLPGDEEENSRDHNRLWDKLSELAGKITGSDWRPGEWTTPTLENGAVDITPNGKVFQYRWGVYNHANPPEYPPEIEFQGKITCPDGVYAFTFPEADRFPRDAEGILWRTPADGEPVAVGEYFIEGETGRCFLTPVETGSSTIDATGVTVTPAGGITSTDVQAALEELDSELAAHLADTSDAHDASAVSVLDTAGNFTGSDVEAVLAELAAAGGGGGGGGVGVTEEIDYAEKTSNVTASATTEATATTVVTGAAKTYDGSTPVLIEFFAPIIRSGTSTNACILVLYEDGSPVGLMGQVRLGVTGTTDAPVHLVRRRTPSAGSHTYSIRAYSPSGDATVFAGAGGSGAYTPAYLRIVKATAPAGGPVHAFRVRRSASQSIGSGTFTKISFDTEDKDTDNGFAATSTDVTIQTAGFWQFNAQVYAVSPGTNHIFIQILKNGSVITEAGPWDHTGYDIRTAVSGGIDCAVGDVITVQTYQDSGSNKDFRGELDGHLVQATAGSEPWRVEINPAFGGTAVAGTWVFNPDGNSYLRGYVYNPSKALNDEITFPVVLSAGTWRIDVSYIKGANVGIATFRLDGVSVGTIDGYAAATAYNQTGSITGIAVTTGGKKVFGIKMASKNASATDYQWDCPLIVLTRTA